MTDHVSKPFKTTGLQHVFAAFGYSLAGARVLWREQAARHEVAMYVASLALFLWAGAAPSAFAILTGLFLLVLCIEAVNTAGEEIVDQVSPEISGFAKRTKDLLSFAVFCCLVMFFGFVASVLAGVI